MPRKKKFPGIGKRRKNYYRLRALENKCKQEATGSHLTLHSHARTDVQQKNCGLTSDTGEQDNSSDNFLPKIVVLVPETVKEAKPSHLTLHNYAHGDLQSETYVATSDTRERDNTCNEFLPETDLTPDIMKEAEPSHLTLHSHAQSEHGNLQKEISVATSDMGERDNTCDEFLPETDLTPNIVKEAKPSHLTLHSYAQSEHGDLQKEISVATSDTEEQDNTCDDFLPDNVVFTPDTVVEAKPSHLTLHSYAKSAHADFQPEICMATSNAREQGKSCADFLSKNVVLAPDTVVEAKPSHLTLHSYAKSAHADFQPEICMATSNSREQGKSCADFLSKNVVLALETVEEAKPSHLTLHSYAQSAHGDLKLETCVATSGTGERDNTCDDFLRENIVLAPDTLEADLTSESKGGHLREKSTSHDNGDSGAQCGFYSDNFSDRLGPEYEIISQSTESLHNADPTPDTLLCNSRGGFDHCNCIVHELDKPLCEPTETDTFGELESLDGFKAHEFIAVFGRVGVTYSPDIDEDSLPFELHFGLFSDLLSKAHDIHALEFSIIKNGCDLSLVKFYLSSVQVMYDVTIKSDLTVSVHVNGRRLPKCHPLFSDQPMHYADVNDVINLIKQMNKFKVCIGNSDAEFLSMCIRTESQYAGRVEHYSTPEYTQTIRSIRCFRLTKADRRRCTECQKYRGTLRKKSHRKFHKPPIKSKYSPHRAMSPSELQAKLTHLKKMEAKLADENRRLKKKVQELLNHDSVQSCALTTVVTNCIEECNTIVKQDQSSDEQSFQTLSEEEQIEFNQCKSETTVSQCGRLTVEAPIRSKYKPHSEMSSSELQAELTKQKKVGQKLKDQNRRLEKKIQKLLMKCDSVPSCTGR